MLFPDPICGVVAAATASEAERQLREAIRSGARTIELRLDYLRNAAERAALLKRIPAYSRRATLIATCRTLDGGGKFAGSRADEISVLAQAVSAGCRWCDVELETAAALPARKFASRAGARSPPRLRARFSRLAE